MRPYCGRQRKRAMPSPWRPVFCCSWSYRPMQCDGAIFELGVCEMKIAHLTSVHPHFDTRIFIKECKALAAAGHDVTLVVPTERSSHTEGVTIRAVPVPGTRLMRMLLTTWAVFRAALSEKAQLYHFHDPELIPAGLLLKLLRRKVIYDVHEHVPGSILQKEWIAPWLRGIVSRSAALAEWLGSLCFDGIVAATPVIARRFPPGKTATVQNFPILDELAATTTLPYQERPPRLIYCGGISRYRGVEEMVAAIGHVPARYNARLVLAGRFSPAGLEEEVARNPGWERVEFLGWQQRALLAEQLGRARAGLVLLQPGPNYTDAQPNKLFEYMSVGLPVIASDFPLWREFVDDGSCGLLVDPSDTQAIAEAIAWLLEHPEEAEAMGGRGQEAVRKRYNWDMEKTKLFALYEKLLSA